MTPVILQRARYKAEQSPIRYRVTAIGVNAKNEVIGMCHNTVGIHLRRQAHAEERLMVKHRGIKKILIVRIGHGGDFRPINPCDVCAKMARKRGIQIISTR